MDSAPDKPTPPREHLLVVEDEHTALKALRWQLASFEQTCVVNLVQDAEQALRIVDDIERRGDLLAVVVADQMMPGMTGVELLEVLHRRHPGSSKILFTGRPEVDVITRAVNHAGLDRYIPKPWQEQDLCMTVGTLLQKFRLARDNERLIHDLRDRNLWLTALNEQLEQRVEERTHALSEANSRLAELAITDGLTGVHNYRFFHQRCDLEAERSGRTRRPLSVLMLDVDQFKRFNDQYGHLAGDAALQRVANSIGDRRRVNDIVARYGGDEFAVLLPDTRLDAAGNVAERVRERIAQVELDVGDKDDTRVELTVSIGVAGFPDNTDDPNRLLQLADTALYQAKLKGRSCVELFGQRPVANE